MDALRGPRADLARVIPRRQRVSWQLGLVLAAAFAILVIPTITADRWLGVGNITHNEPVSMTVRVPPFAGFDSTDGHVSGGGVLIARGEKPDRDTTITAHEIREATPRGATAFFAYLMLVGVLAGLFTHHMRRSIHGRLLRVQLVTLATIVGTAFAVKIVMLFTGLSILVVPIAVFAIVPTLVLDRVVGLATGMLAALVVSFLVPFDYGIAILFLVQAGAAGLVVAERPKRRLHAILITGAAATVATAATYPLMQYLSVGRLPLAELRDPFHSAWIASAIGPAIATGLAILTVPIFQLLVGQITRHRLVELEDMSHPLLKQIADRAPGTWQHSLAMANMAQCAADAIGADGRLVRVGAYFHDLGKSLNPKYFIENLEPGETSPHDKLPPEVSCDAIFAHVTEGILSARRAGLHERIIDFMHMHHGNGVLEYFWAKCREQDNPKKLTVEHFRYPGVPPQSRETAILSICDAVEAAARTLKKPEVSAIDNLVQRIVYGKLHLGQLDESGLSMGDLRRVAESLRDTIRHANHGRIEYPWQKAQQDASAHADYQRLTQTGPRLDSLDRHPKPETVVPLTRETVKPHDSSELATKTTAPVARPTAEARLEKSFDDAPAVDVDKAWDDRLASDDARTQPAGTPFASRGFAAARSTPEGSAESIDERSLPGASAARTRPAVSTPRDAAVAGAWKPDFKEVSAEIPLRRPASDFDSTMPAPKLALEEPIPNFGRDETVRAPKTTLEVEEEDVVVELNESKHDAPAVNVAELAAKSATTPPETHPAESDPRMSRVTNPVEDRRPSEEAIKFADDAQSALDKATRDLTVAPLESVEEVAKRAASLPPMRAPTQPPPLGRRSTTVPPPGPSSSGRPATVPPNVTAPPSTVLRPPGPAQVALPGLTAPPPNVVRTPGVNYLDDMITLKPQYEPRPDEDKDDAASTNPTMDAAKDEPEIEVDHSVGDDTSPNIELSNGAPLPRARSSSRPESSWARGLASRIDSKLDDDFGAETPVSAPTRAELQALIDAPPDVTRQQSLDELERLHRETRRDRGSEQELELTRRGTYPAPTHEVDDSDIESAIELAPPARRNAIGIAKKKKPNPE